MVSYPEAATVPWFLSAGARKSKIQSINEAIIPSFILATPWIKTQSLEVPLDLTVQFSDQRARRKLFLAPSLDQVMPQHTHSQALYSPVQIPMNVLLSTRGKGARLDRSRTDRIVRSKSTSAPPRWILLRNSWPTNKIDPSIRARNTKRATFRSPHWGTSLYEYRVYVYKAGIRGI